LSEAVDRGGDRDADADGSEPTPTPNAPQRL
jgi:hypothetical protein